MQPKTVITIIKAFSSWWVTAALVLFSGAAYLYFTFGDAPYTRWAAFMLHTPTGLTLYLGLAANLIASSFRVIRKNLHRDHVSIEKIRTMDAWAEITVGDGNAIRDFAAWAKKQGHEGEMGGNVFRSVKGRLSILPGTVFRAGLVLLMVSLFVGVYTRRTGDMVLREGTEGELFGRKVLLQNIDPRLPDDFLQVGDESTFSLDGVTAVLSSSGKFCRITPGFPARLRGLYYRIIHLGYAQQLAVKTRRGYVEKAVDLDILPPGKTQIVTFPSGNIFLTVGLQPERTITKGILKGKQFNLASPRYHMIVQKGENESEPAALQIRPEERAVLGGTTLTLGSSSPYIEIQAAYDPALRFIYAGFVLTLAGAVFMLSRFFWFRQSLSAVLADASLTIGYSEEFYKKWGIQKFYRWKEELLRDGFGVDKSQSAH